MFELVVDFIKHEFFLTYQLINYPVMINGLSRESHAYAFDYVYARCDVCYSRVRRLSDVDRASILHP